MGERQTAGFAVHDLPGNSLYRFVAARHGRFLANPRDIYIGAALCRYGEYSEREWQVIGRLVRPGAVAIEVGSNIGSHTVPLARALGPRGLVYAFEPQPVIFQNLCANLALNGLANVHAINAGCDERPSTLHCPRIDYRRQDNFGALALDDIATEDGPLQIPVVTLDDMCPTDRLRLIKIDAQRMEAAILRGAAGLIGEFRPLLYVENDQLDLSEELISLIFDLGYRAWWHVPPMYNPANFAGDGENVFGRTVSFNMLCVHRDMEFKVDGLQPVESVTEHPLKAAVG